MSMFRDFMVDLTNIDHVSNVRINSVVVYNTNMSAQAKNILVLENRSIAISRKGTIKGACDCQSAGVYS